MSPLAGLRALERLWLWNNRISSVEPLNGLARLEWLTLGANQLSEIGVLVRLPALREVSFPNNYVDLSDGTPANAVVEELRARDVTVLDRPQLTLAIHQRRGG